MVVRAAQSGAEQGDGEERKGDVEKTTSTDMVSSSSASGLSPLHRERATISPRSQQRKLAPESTASVTGLASEQGGAVHGSLNLYEIAVLYHPDLEIDLEKASGKVEKIITDNGGKITKTDNWGKRKLAYPIAKQEFAVYVFYSVEMPADAAGKIEKAFNITDEIIRFMITRPDLKAMAKAEAMRAEKVKKAAQRADSPASEDDSSDSADALDKGQQE